MYAIRSYYGYSVPRTERSSSKMSPPVRFTVKLFKTGLVAKRLVAFKDVVPPNISEDRESTLIYPAVCTMSPFIVNVADPTLRFPDVSVSELFITTFWS